MACDKLVLLSPVVKSRFLRNAESKGIRKGGYAHYLDLRETEDKLPVRLYCGGIYTGIHKLQFDNEVGRLGLRRTREIVKMICGDIPSIRIARIDWCFDVSGTSVTDLALYCRLTRAQNFCMYKSRQGTTLYLRFAKQVKILMYDRLARLRSIRNPLARFYSADDQLTRVEVQLQSRGIPFRKFRDIERFGDEKLLADISFWELPTKRHGLNNIESLAAEGLLNRIELYGLQATSKLYSSPIWAFLTKELLQPACGSSVPDLNRLMWKSIRDWLENRIRFPRFREPVKS